MTAKLLPGGYTLQLRQDGRGYNVLVPVRCVPCDGSGSRAIVHRHAVTQYESCESCDGWGYRHAVREVYPLSRGQWFVLGKDWDGQTFGSKEAAADAIAASLKPAAVVEPEPRTVEEVIAAVTGFESPV